jgi:hypothetical protein
VASVSITGGSTASKPPLNTSAAATSGCRFLKINSKAPAAAAAVSGPAAAAPPQHEQFFDSQPLGLFFLFPISDIDLRHFMNSMNQ